jgi:nitrous oxidase accessory protein NosD
MRLPLLTYLTLLLLSLSTFSCSSKEEEAVSPLKDITGRWDVTSRHSIVYNSDGKVIYNPPIIPGKDGEYEVFTADKKFEVYFDNQLSYSGTYTYTNTSLTTTTSAGTGTSIISLLTATRLTITDDGRNGGKDGVVSETIYTKH